MKCPNLKNLFGENFKIAHDPAAEFEPAGSRDPWLFVIPGKYGEVYPYSAELLAAHVTSGAVRVQLAKLPGVTKHNWADDSEAIFLFAPDLFDKVAPALRARRRRKLGAAHKQALLDGGTGHQF